jgi:hypothetical protein
MPKLTGAALLKARSEGTSTNTSRGRKAGAFTPLFSLREGESKFIHFLRDDLEEVYLHTWVRVPPRFPEKNTRGYDWEVFASRTRNAEFDDDYSLLESELDHWPYRKIAGIAVVLDPVYDGEGERLQNLVDLKVAGNTVKKDNGEKIFYPQWQLIFEAYGSFWENLVVISNSFGLDAYPLQVTRVASDNYQFIAVQNVKVDKDALMEKVPTVQDEIARLGSEERYNDYFGPGKPRIEKQEQRHNFLQSWIQEERAAKLGLEGGDDEEPEAEEVEEAPEPPKKTRKSRVSFDELAKLADGKKEDIEPYTPEEK